MKIKQKRKVNYHELIEWVWKNNVYGTFKDPETAVTVYVQSGGAINVLNNRGLPVPNSRFEIEEEVDVDEDTKFKRVLAIYKTGWGTELSAFCSHASISLLIRETKENKTDEKITRFYYPHPDGTMTLLWKDGEMVE